MTMAKHLQSHLSDWLEKEPGALLLSVERTQIERTLKKILKPMAGDYLVQIGGLPELSAELTIRYKYYLHTEAKPGGIQIELPHLPLANNSVDVIIIVHILEFMVKPRHLLREISQALAPGGQLIIINLNPWSLWGIKHLFTFKPRFPWRGHFWSIWHIKQWLRWCEFRIVASDTFCFRPPVKSEFWWRRLLWLEAFGSFCFPALGAFFLIIAQKRGQKVQMQPLKLRCKSRAIKRGFEPTPGATAVCPDIK